MESKIYSETSYLSYNITPCHNPKELQHHTSLMKQTSCIINFDRCRAMYALYCIAALFTHRSIFKEWRCILKLTLVMPAAWYLRLAATNQSRTFILDRNLTSIECHNKLCYIYRAINNADTDPNVRAVSGVGLRPLACRDCGFECHRGHGCLCVVQAEG